MPKPSFSIARILFCLAVCMGLTLACGGGGSAQPRVDPPGGLAYSANPAVYVVGIAIPANTPSVAGGAATGYAVAPALPAGLVLNPTTGVVTGTPTAVAAQADYTITASNSGGSTTAKLTLTVRMGIAKVHVAGMVLPTSSSPVVAYEWTDGVATPLSDGKKPGWAESVTVSNGDVYIAGERMNDASRWVATVWKNGTPTLLTDGNNSASLHSICVSGSDVYVGGNEMINAVRIAKIWKNGVPVSLTDGTHEAQANGVAVSGKDVYVAGYEVNGAGRPVARLWKNGASIALSDGTQDAYAYSVFVSGGDVYVAGREKSSTSNHFQAKIWKNGVPTAVTDGTRDASANSVFISSGDVYVGGSEFSQAVNLPHAILWKNGDSIKLASDTDGSISTVASLFVDGGDVYASGTGGGAAIVWKNAVPSALIRNVANAVAYSVYVERF